MATPSSDRSVSLANAWRVLGITSLGVFAASLDSTVLFVAFPSIRATFPSVSVAQLSWVLNAYTIVFAACLVFSGGLADLLGRRKVFLAGVTIFTIASMLCGLSSSPTLLISARVLQAIGGVLISPASLALVLAAFPQSKRSTAVSLWGAVGAIAAAIGPSLGSAIVQTVGWRWAFFLNLPVGIVTIWLGRRILSESRNSDIRKIPDLIGVLLSILAIGLIAFATVQSSEWGWNNRLTLICLAGGVILLGLFLDRSSRVASPAIDLKLFQNANYRFANAATFVFYIVFTAVFFGFVLFLTQVWGYSILNAGLAITPGPLLVAVIAPFAGRVADVRGHRVLLVPGGISLALGGLYLLTQSSATSAFWVVWLPSTLLIGTGIGLTLPILSSAAVHDLSSTQFAIGSAVNQAIRQLGSVFGVALVVALVGNVSSQIALDAFDRLFIVPIIGGLLISILSLGIQTRSSSLIRNP